MLRIGQQPQFGWSDEAWPGAQMPMDEINEHMDVDSGL
jgi:hypothetical protein